VNYDTVPEVGPPRLHSAPFIIDYLLIILTFASIIHSELLTVSLNKLKKIKKQGLDSVELLRLNILCPLGNAKYNKLRARFKLAPQWFLSNLIRHSC
jgi:hypothetical protein